MDKVESGLNYKTKEILTIICFFIFAPLGVILMWKWMRWNILIKILLSLGPILGLATLMLVIYGMNTLALPKEENIRRARDIRYINGSMVLSSAISVYRYKHGVYPPSIEARKSGEMEFMNIVDTLIADGELGSGFKQEKLYKDLAGGDLMSIEYDKEGPRVCFKVVSTFLESSGIKPGDLRCSP